MPFSKKRKANEQKRTLITSSECNDFINKIKSHGHTNDISIMGRFFFWTLLILKNLFYK